MSDASPDDPGIARLLAALDVPRNATIGFGAGVALAALAYAIRVGELLGPVRGPRGSPALFVLLAFVLAVSAGALITTVLTVRSALRLARDLDE